MIQTIVYAVEIGQPAYMERVIAEIDGKVTILADKLNEALKPRNMVYTRSMFYTVGEKPNFANTVNI